MGTAGSIAFVLVLVLLSGCVFTVDPRSLDYSAGAAPPDPSTPPVELPPVYIPVPHDDGNSRPPPGTDTNTVLTPPVQPPATIALSASEVSTHAKRTDCWMIIEGNVYTLSTFVNHPGGTRFVPYCGRDGTVAYNQQGHSRVADAMLTRYYLGKLNETIPLSRVSG